MQFNELIRVMTSCQCFMFLTLNMAVKKWRNKNERRTGSDGILSLTNVNTLAKKEYEE